MESNMPAGPRRNASLFVAWIAFQRRQVSMAGFFGFETIFMPLGAAPRFLRPVQYGLQAVRTLLLFWCKRPSTVWVQLPQVPLLTAALIYRWMRRGRVKVVVDCHNPAFRPPWDRWPLAAWSINRADLIVLHNDEVTQRAIAFGLDASRIAILEDRPADLPACNPHALAPDPRVLFMTWFHPDEPIAEIYAAARLAPEIRFVIAGETARARGLQMLHPAPANVELAGYLSGQQLLDEIGAAHAILGLTKDDDEQLSTAAEAVGAGKAMVLSGTPLLRRLYPTGAVYVDAREAISIAEGCRRACAQRILLEEQTIRFRNEQIEHCNKRAEFIAKALDGAQLKKSRQILALFY